LALENLKRTRGEATSISSDKFSKEIDHKFIKNSKPINKNISHDKIPPSLPSNISQIIIKTAYNENRLKSMSHIKQINPKYRNYIIPVLPGAFNKFSNI
jgi:hypothetical protein